ncbi:hypothetical protein PCASD_15908 [Puccinia coronata f. sp. avenae]|uniref:Uncharacterized protein n=1 Tax=Puccinia coronata f. sp. avenae TaxID=200324 RepID=A0A2N5TA46_9BASI|nr:hypothetical protein PCASD_15908 [Puccinia coronata f. sp. avenae]
MDTDQNLNEAPLFVDEREGPTLDDFQNSEDEPDGEAEGIPDSIFSEEEPDDNETELNWIDMIDVAMEQIGSEPKDRTCNPPFSNFCQEETMIDDLTPDKTSWYPFLNKEYLVASLLVGYLYKIISRDMYHQIQSILTLYHVILPRWEAIQHMRAKIQTLINHTIIEKESVFGNPMFALNAKEIISDDLMNPLVAPHIDFFAEETKGNNIYKASQSNKWLKELAPDLRVQMVKSKNKKHFYNLEPVKMKNGKITVPVFFYIHQNEYFAKCYTPVYKSNQPNSKIQIGIPKNLLFNDEAMTVFPVDNMELTYDKIRMVNGMKLSECCRGNIYEINLNNWDLTILLPNPWRTKADGRILRHMPVNLYCDDTSGNKSKKWNKHISYYFTLSGLPPKILNQQFNCHFLCTSNIAGSLELGEMVVEQFNEMSDNGFEAYNITISQKVLVMTSVLCFLADSPMHAKITNTPVPGNSLNPCRYCILSSEKMKDRKHMPYICQFVQKNYHGLNCPNRVRTMEETSKNSKALWAYVKETMKLDKLNKKSLEFGVRDQINQKFAKQLFDYKAERVAIIKSGEELPEDMTNEIPQKLVDMEKNNPEKLFNPFLKLRGFDMVKDTPVDVLHVFLLGVVKYLFQDFMDGLNQKSKEKLLALWYSFNTNSLNIPSIRPTSMVQLLSSLIGKDFRIILQAAPFICFQFMTPSDIKIWSSLCHLGSLVFQVLTTWKNILKI